MNTSAMNTKQNTIFLPPIIAIGLLGRVIPHLSNVSPLISLGLFSVFALRPGRALITMFGIMLASDLLLSWLLGYQAFGSWSLFTYSGIAIVIFLARNIKCNFKSVGMHSVNANLIYWIWTNIGVFAFSGMYPHSGAGLMACMLAALPFLAYSLIGTVIWSSVLFGMYHSAEKRWLSSNKVL